MLLATIGSYIQRNIKNKPRMTEKLNIEFITDDSLKYLYQRRFKKAISENKIQINDDIETAWKKLGTNMQKRQ